MEKQIKSKDGELKCRVFYSQEYGAAVVEHHGVINADDARQIVTSVIELLKDKEHKYMIQDVRRISATKVDKDVREVYADAGKKITFEKIAMIGANPMTRMMSKILLSISGDSKNTKFLKSEKEALLWFKGD